MGWRLAYHERLSTLCKKIAKGLTLKQDFKTSLTITDI